jgi:hypothetical protein
MECLQIRSGTNSLFLEMIRSYLHLMRELVCSDPTPGVGCRGVCDRERGAVVSLRANLVPNVRSTEI